MMKNIYLLNEEQVDFYWHDICEGLKDCPGFYDYYSPEWVWEQIKSGHLLVWALSNGQIKGIVLTRILIFPKKRVFEILALYGIDMLEFFQEMEDTFMLIGKKYGCSCLSALARPGVQRKLTGFKVETTAMVLRREIPEIGEH